MDWFRKLTPQRRRVVIIGAGVGVGLVLVLLARRSGGSSAPAATEVATGTVAGGGGPGLVGGGPLPNAGYDSSLSDLLSSVVEGVEGLRGDISALPVPSGASDVAREVGEVLRPIVDSVLAAPVTTAPPVTASPAPAVAPTPPPAPAPRPAQTGPVGGRRVGPWATKAQRDGAVSGIPANKVRKYSEGGKFYAEIFD